MSLKGLGQQIVTIGTQFFYRFSRANIPLITAKVAGQTSKLPLFNPNLSKNTFFRVVQRTLRGRFFLRPFSTLHFRTLSAFAQRRNYYRPWQRGRRSQFNPLDRIKRVFVSNTRYNKSLLANEYPQNLDSYELGNYIAHGCNAAVYQLRIRDSDLIQKPLEDYNREYPLALKVMFNYDYSLPERFIWQDMGAELVPLKEIPKSALIGRMGSFRPLRRSHPNIIKMHTAFIDQMPTLAEAEFLFPEAIPNWENHGIYISEPKTLFVVMKRYNTTLREYSLRNEMPKRTGQVLLGQLLEALVFLQQNKITHRDMKSDNILLDYNSEDEIPHLVLSDFGSALVTSFKLVYIDEFTDMGGNAALRAPEISRTKLVSGVVLDYGKADLWAAGTIAYEMFGCGNPFYSRYSSRDYQESQLPQLPQFVPNVIHKLVNKLLKINKTERPTVTVAANTVILSLFALMENASEFMKNMANGEAIESISDKTNEILHDTISLFAAETFLAHATQRHFSASELQLRASFFSRIDPHDVADSIALFADN